MRLRSCKRRGGTVVSACGLVRTGQGRSAKTHANAPIGLLPDSGRLGSRQSLPHRRLSSVAQNKGEPGGGPPAGRKSASVFRRFTESEEP
ncbi:Uncharacterised protein [Bordetella pertussis]|nr:Uncharacterised protein [Bordetella pertussis]